MNTYDLIVIGSGPGGYVAAIRASQLGLKTAIIEKSALGGVCLNEGCIPTKSLLRNAEVARLVQEGGKEFGFSIENLQLDYGQAFKRSRQVASRLSKGVGFLMKKNSIDVITGTAQLLANDTVQVTAQDGSQQVFQAKNIILATGANPMDIPGVIVDGEKVVFYRPVIMAEQLPKTAIIIGGGAIGVEFATVWHAYGTEVTIIEMMPHLVPYVDEEVSVELEKTFKKQGIKFLTGTKVKSANATDNGTSVVVDSPDGEQTLEADLTLVGTGFRANTRGLALDVIGVELDRKGFVVVDEHMATNTPGIWAVGDVTGKFMLAHVASTMGIIAAENIAGRETEALNYQMVPHTTFCHPQVAGFGLTEPQAIEAGHSVKIGRFPFQASGKALGMGEYTGFAKLIVNADNDELLGAFLIGPEVGELLPELTLAQKHHLKVEDIARNIHTHPTLSEVLMNAAEDAEGYSIHS